MDTMLEALRADLQNTERPARRRRDALYAPTFGLRERGDYDGHIFESSAYTTASLHPFLTGALLGAGVMAINTLLRRAPKTRVA